jgi:polyketide synthase PksR
LIGVARQRGLKRSNEDAYQEIKKMISVQRAFEIDKFCLLPLNDPQDVRGYYFRNKGGVFLGNLAPYFMIETEKIPLEGTNYWEEWKLHLPNLSMIDVNPDNHMVLLSDENTHNKIITFCEKLYSKIPDESYPLTRISQHA